jgi:hypothetical protein
MAKTYRSARGKTVDLDRILNDNETTRAVGNMNVNARGDAIDSKNKIVQSRNERIKNQYRKQHKQHVSDDVVPTSKRHAQKIAAEATLTDIVKSYQDEPLPKPSIDSFEDVPLVAEPATVDNLPGDPAPIVEPATSKSSQSGVKGGLAAAIAKARESKQELMKTERQQARENNGVKRI